MVSLRQKLFLITILLHLAVNLIFAQSDSLYKVFKPDSSLSGIQRYNNRYSIGNNGVTFVPLVYDYKAANIGFNYSPLTISRVIYTPDQLKYLDTHTPFTELVLLAGAKNEVVSKFIHSQNVNKKLNITLEFQRLRSDGFYLRQSSLVTDFAASVYYHTTDYHYTILSGAIINSVKYDENGGLVNDGDFQNGPLQDRTLLAINLNNANRQYRSNEFYFKQYYSPGIHHPEGDTNSTHYTKAANVWLHSLNTGVITQSFFDSAYFGQNPRSSVFPAPTYDTIRTSDLTRMIFLRNQFGFEHRPVNAQGVPRKIGFGFGINQELVLLNQRIAKDSTITGTDFQAQPNVYNTTINNWGIYLKAFNFSNNRFNFAAQGAATLLGYNAGDNTFDFKSRYLLSDSITALHLDANFANKHPDFIWVQNISNYFTWHNNLSNEQSAFVHISLTNPHIPFEIGVGAFSLAHAVYFNGSQVKQDNGQINGASVQLMRNFHLRNWNLAVKLIGQYLPDSSSLHLPAFVSETSVYYANFLFKKALQFQIGFDLFYNSAYYANGYSPMVGQFYTQNDKMLGSYPYFDVFLNARISRARIIVKYENINAYLNNFSYFYALHYPYPDGALKLGVIWRFFD